MTPEDRKRIWVERPNAVDAPHRRLSGPFRVRPVQSPVCLAIGERAHDLAGQFVAMLGDNLPVLVCLFVLVPAVVWDAMRFTHRLVGPLAEFPPNDERHHPWRSGLAN